ncbi:MAG: hypothetical protein HY046_03835 [Acidobacteria bacterium]|nr:hypothetical protein [Acidobacteriota bacterium]
MRILFDQGAPVAIRQALEKHTVRTANDEGWSTLSNGDLLRAAEERGFDVLLTTDNNLPRQQSLQGRKIAVVILNRNRWMLIKLQLERIAEAVETAKAGSFVVVEIPQV